MKYTTIYLDGYSFNTISGSHTHFSLTADVVSPIKYRYGINGIGINDRVADAGKISFSLNNIDNTYLPSVATGWGKNTWIILNVGYYVGIAGEVISTRFIGKIEDIKLKNPVGGLPTVEITAVDAMSDFVNHKLAILPMQGDLTFYTGTQYLYNYMPLDDFTYWAMADARGGDFKTFTTVFDANENPTLYSEMFKMATSELGYGYLTFKNNLSKINIESGTYRDSPTYTSIPLIISLCGKYLSEASDNLTQETGDKLYLDETTTTALTNSMFDYAVEYGSNVINEISVKGYPRQVDSASAVLFNQDEVLPLFPFEPIYLKISYSAGSSVGSTRIAGSGIISPVPRVDYWMNDSSDGSGADMTTYLNISVVDASHSAASFGAFGAILKLENTSALESYVTQLQLRGYPVYYYNPIESLLDSYASIQAYGLHADVLDQKYITSIVDGSAYATEIINAEKDPRTLLKSIKFLANINNTMMNAYLYHDVGDYINIQITDLSINAGYFIQGVEAEISLSGAIKTTWYLK